MSKTINDLIVKDMKTLFIKGLAFAAAVAAMASCTKDATEEEPAPVFPQLQSVTIQAGDQQSLNFTADKDWKLSIDKTTWCTFLDGEVETAQLSGLKGEVTVTVLVKDNGLDFNSDVAKLDLTLGNKTETIFEITRPGKAREVKLYIAIGDDEDFKESESVEFGFESWGDLKQTRFTIAANFDWTVSAPDGFVFTVKGEEIPGLTGKSGVGPDAAEFSYAEVSPKEDIAPYEKNLKLVVTDTEGQNPVEFSFNYPGMHPYKMTWELENLSGWGFSFSHDGFITQMTPDGVQSTDKKEGVVNVKVKNMNYTIHKIEIKDNAAVELGDDSWFSVNDDKKGRLTVSAKENTGNERKAYLLILPEAKEKEFKLSDVCDEWGNLNYETGYSDLSLDISQKGAPSEANSFKVIWALNPIEALNIIPIEEDPEYGEMIKYGVKPSHICPGSSDDNSHVLNISLSDVNGGLSIGVLNFPEGYYVVDENGQALFRFDNGTNWDPTKYVEPTTTYPDNLPAIVISPDQFKVQNLGTVVWIQFFKTIEEKEANTASATLVIRIS